MRDRLPEKDWKILRKLNDVALDRFCERVLAEVRTLVDDESKTNHKRYGTLYGLIQDRDKQMARAFDGFSRSKAVEQFALIRAHGLLTTEELADVSPETRESIERLAEFFGKEELKHVNRGLVAHPHRMDQSIGISSTGGCDRFAE